MRFCGGGQKERKKESKYISRGTWKSREKLRVMSYRRSRKRRRSQAFPAEEEEEEEEAIIQDAKDTQQKGETSEENGEELKKEDEIWDAFREEHFEGGPVQLFTFCEC
jgi:hypothetical protein